MHGARRRPLGRYLDAERRRVWPEDAIVNVWSLGKAMCALSVLKPVDDMANAMNGHEHPAMPTRSLLAEAIKPRSDSIDLVIDRPTKFGLRLQLSQLDRPTGTSPRAFGHYGNGGHLGFGNPDANLGFAYHMNHQSFAWRDPRNTALVDAVYASL